MIWRGKRVIHDVSTSLARGSYTRGTALCGLATRDTKRRSPATGSDG